MLAYGWYQFVQSIMAAFGPVRQDRISGFCRMYRNHLGNPANLEILSR